MKNALALLVSIVGFGLASTMAAACADPTLEEGATDAASLSTSLTCKTMTFAKGSMGRGQSITALATKDLTGSQDSWNKYVELSAGSDATCTFSSGSVPTALSIATNYRGPTKGEMLVRFSAWDFVANAWVVVGDNGFAADWKWSAATLPLPAPVSRFASPTGEIRIRYASANAADASQLDQLVLVASSDGSPAPAPTTTATTTPTTTPTTPPPSDGGTPPPTTGPTGIWKPTPGTTWQWQLTGSIDTSVAAKMYDIDLYETSASTISALKAKGIKVICYFSAGSYEKGRPDSAQFPAAAIGNVLDGWPDEKWLDTRNATIRSIMSARMDLAAQKGCDGVEPDNVDGYQNNPGFPLTAATQLDYNRFLATTAHAKNLSIALKNDLDQVKDLVASFDFAVNEECFEYDECDMLKPFITANKAVFNVEYVAASQASTLCPKANALNFDTLIKKLDLDAWRVSCR